MYFSIIIPVYNRPNEIKELLESLTKQTFIEEFEIVIVEDGSSIDSEEIVKTFTKTLNISYYYKSNTGPGDSRNFGMKNAKGDYFIIFDSDCIIPENYLQTVHNYLTQNYVDCYGGPDAAHGSFTVIQKAINYTMTSFLTTGGVRGKNETLGKFQPRSFNMGISKKAFEVLGGFGNIHPGEDPDLSMRLWKLGFKTALISQAYVYHKRRINWYNFFIQVNKFGKARPILNKWHPEYNKLTYFFPSVFMLALDMSIILALFGVLCPIAVFMLYFVILFVFSSINNKSIKIGAYTLIATILQFYGYGMGFLNSYFKVIILKKNPEKVFPELFFK
ncbi:MAG: glycosyltransferase [Flavobacteriaceae bacterium]|jgi:glycosyltransferase involved in cell wall biosynthesis|nr:glycosyltransferase [Flavobacteriaceae bacterium]